MKLKCEICGKEFEVDETNIDIHLKHVQCPFCGEISNNPYYEEEV